MSKSQELLAEAGTPEYLAWGGGFQHPTWFRLEDGKYSVLQEDKEGFIRSSALPGFWLDMNAVREREWKTVFAGIRKGIRSDLEDYCQAIDEEA